MELDKQFILDELRKQGQNEHVQKAIQELPDKIDHERHASLLTKFGIDPGKLVASAIERGVGSSPSSTGSPPSGNSRPEPPVRDTRNPP
jgi:hypothetical protein